MPAEDGEVYLRWSPEQDEAGEARARKGRALTGDATLMQMADLQALGLCPGCGNKRDHMPFRDQASHRESRISGMCQSCQNQTFRSRS